VATGTADTSNPGSLVISLDFELHWGVRDHLPGDGAYRENLLGARRAIPLVLDAFAEHGVAATWATVGMLFAQTSEELERFSPLTRPTYVDHRLYPYAEAVGADEEEDPIHFGWSLLERIAASPRQEVGSHTFSHYYCLESGQGEASFRADLEAARAIAEYRGLELRSLVLPRNQWNPDYAPIVRQLGFTAYRGVQSGFPYRPRRHHEQQSQPIRAVRLADAYLDLTGPSLTPWDGVIGEDGTGNVAASRYLRPYSRSRRALDTRRLKRIVAAMEQAARERSVFHLWWHPHDFGADTEENMAFLRRVLSAYDELRDHHGLESHTMGEVVDMARRAPSPAVGP
jgi:peptidoglycan/xylan/chitin deacetylase (PgdA/CDA1 family)